MVRDAGDEAYERMAEEREHKSHDLSLPQSVPTKENEMYGRKGEVPGKASKKLIFHYV